MSNSWIDDLEIDRVEKVKIGSIMTGFHQAEQLKQCAIDGLKAKLGVILAPFFDRDPRIGAICFPGYTPTFNDGDACEYDVYLYSLEYRIRLPDGSELRYRPGEGADEEEHSLIGEALAQTLINDYDTVSDIIRKLPLGLWQSHGEGLYVIDRNGHMQVEHYDHD